MTGSDVRNYVVAALLLLATVPLYRYVIERGHAGDRPPSRLLAPAVVERTPSLSLVDSEPRRMTVPEVVPPAPLPLQLGSEGGVQCWHGVLYQQTRSMWLPVSASGGRVARCDIEVARRSGMPASSAGPSDQ